MAVDMFLKIEGVKGESEDAKHKGEVDILSWSWGLSQEGTMYMGGGGGTGKVNVQDLHLTKYADASTTNMMQTCCTGKHYPKALLTVRKAGGEQIEYYKIDMTDVIISSYSVSGTSGDRVSESLSLNFAKYECTYAPQTATGAAGGEMKQGWDVKQNVPV
jgi:type VI secretion system secreted protein Hcp